MMSVTDTAIQDLIVTEVGDVNGILAQNIMTMWAMNAPYRAVPGMQYLMTKVQAVETVLTALRATAVRKTVGPLTLDNSQQIGALERLLADLEAKSVTLTKRTMASRGSVGVITAVTPEVPPPYQPSSPYGNVTDANDPSYRGDAYGYIPPRTT